MGRLSRTVLRVPEGETPSGDSTRLTVDHSHASYRRTPEPLFVSTDVII